jgi:hypothetical protein
MGVIWVLARPIGFDGDYLITISSFRQLLSSKATFSDAGVFKIGAFELDAS